MASRIAMALIAFGFALHTYTVTVQASFFSLGFWLWMLAPYVGASALLWMFKQPHAAAGALFIPVLLDCANYYSVFVRPESSTAALGMIFVPLWNLVLFGPIGGTLGWLAGRRQR